MGKTSIEWTDHSVNPIRARQGDSIGHYCERISTGCARCYASELQRRFKMPGFPSVGTHETDKTDVVPFLDYSKLQTVLKRRKPTKFFWCDMTDMFGEWVPDAWIEECFVTMALTPQHIHQVLTKRPDRMVQFFAGLQEAADDHAPNTATGEFSPLDVLNIGHAHRNRLGGPASGWHAGGRVIDRDTPWPLPNVWLGTSVENQKAADSRIPHLLACPAAVRFLSAEPLLSRIKFSVTRNDRWEADYLTGIWEKDHGWDPETGPCVEGHHGPSLDWVIVGVESNGPRVGRLGEFKSEADWIDGAIDIVGQCQEAGVACFVKQIPIDGRVSKDPTEWPEELRVREFPQTAIAKA